jgi:hypothetical protein
MTRLIRSAALGAALSLAIVTGVSAESELVPVTGESESPDAHVVEAGEPDDHDATAGDPDADLAEPGQPDDALEEAGDPDARLEEAGAPEPPGSDFDE